MRRHTHSPCAGCLSRRQFLAVTAGGAAAAFAGCSDPSGPTPGRISIVVADFPALANTGVLVKVGSAHAVKRTGTASFIAYSMYCTHAGCLTSLNSQQFSCPCHGSSFDDSGAVITGPATKALPQLPTSYDAGTDTLTIN